MNLSYFGNNRYAVLNYLYKNTAEHKGTLMTITNQQQIADSLHLAKLTVNAIMRDLMANGFIVRIDTKGKYQLTDKGKDVINKMHVCLF